MSNIREMIKKNTMLVALFIVVVMFQVLISWTGKGSLLTPSNISNLISQNSYVVILATGMLLCILTGGNIDLSVGSVVAMIGAIAGVLIVNLQVNFYLAIIICLIIGSAVGAWHGFWIAYMRIPAFIVTLSGMLLWRGAALIILNGLTISPFPDQYLGYFTSFLPNIADKEFLASATLVIGVIICLIFVAAQMFSRRKKQRESYETDHMGIFVFRLAFICAVVIATAYLLGQHKGFPVTLILVAVIVMAYSYYTSKTVPGRHLYAMGGNEKAAKLSGINTNKVLFFAYTNMGFLSAVTALMCVARFNSAAPSAGTNYELDAIGSCFIGGASAYGGTGTVGGAVVGAIFMGVLNNGMSIMGIDSNWQRAVKGLVLLVAVVFDVISKKRNRSI